MTVLNGYLATGTLDLDDAGDGDVTGGPTLDMSLVERGTLSASVVLHSDTSGMDIIPEWQVSPNNGDWYNVVAANNEASTAPVPVSLAADTNSIALTTTTVVFDDDAIVTSFATSASIVTKSGAGLNGVIGAAAMVPARSVTIKTSTHTGSYNIVDPIVITGTNANDEVITNSTTLTQANGNETLEVYGDVDGLVGWKTVTSVAFPAQVDTAGTFKVGAKAAILYGNGLTGVLGGDTIDPPRKITITAGDSAGSYNGNTLGISGLDADGAAAFDGLNLVGTDGTETLTTAAEYSLVQSVYLAPMADASGAFIVGTDAGTRIDSTSAVPAPDGVYGMPLARMSIRIDGDDGTADDTYSIAYNFVKRDPR